MADFFLPFTTGAIQFSWRDVVDIIIVAAIIYSLIRIMSGTRALQVLKGLGIILALAIIFPSWICRPLPGCSAGS